MPWAAVAYLHPYLAPAPWRSQSDSASSDLCWDPRLPRGECWRELTRRDTPCYSAPLLAKKPDPKGAVHSTSARVRGKRPPAGPGRDATLLQRCLRGGILKSAGANGSDFRIGSRTCPSSFSKGRRHIPRQRHRVKNWRECDVCLRNRGSLTIWLRRMRLPVGRRSNERRRRSASLFESCHRNRADSASGVSIGASPERRVDWFDHANAGDRPARP